MPTDLGHEQLLSRVKLRYCAPEWATLLNVHLNDRQADAIAVNTFHSRAYEIVGFEAKSSRADWLRELANGAKADKIARFCNRWFIVANVGVVKPEELPAGWGLMLPSADTIRQSRPSPFQQVPPPPPALLASMFRRAVERSVDDVLLKAQYDAGLRDGKKRPEPERMTQQTVRDLDRLRENVAEFERASGVKIGEYRGDDIGKAVKLVLDAPHTDWLFRDAEGSATALEKAAGRIRAALAEARQPPQEPRSLPSPAGTMAGGGS